MLWPQNFLYLYLPEIAKLKEWTKSKNLEKKV